MQFVLKYLLNPGCKHSNSARDFVEASILDKSAPFHDGKIRRVPVVSNHATNRHKKACFFNLVKLTKMQSTAVATKASGP